MHISDARRAHKRINELETEKLAVAKNHLDVTTMHISDARRAHKRINELETEKLAVAKKRLDVTTPRKTKLDGLSSAASLPFDIFSPETGTRGNLVPPTPPSPLTDIGEL